ncbi:hypothetical protein ACBV55_12830 [Franconibacter pulveris]
MSIFPLTELSHVTSSVANFDVVCNKASLFSGALCGALIYMLNLTNISLSRRIFYFLISFLLAINCAEVASHLLVTIIAKFINPPPQINCAFSAALMGAVVVRVINVASDNIIKYFPGNK